MAITVGAAAHQTAQTQAQSAKSQAQTQTQSQPHASKEGKNVSVKSALAPAIKQVAQLAAGPVGQVAVQVAAGAVGALLNTKA